MFTCLNKTLGESLYTIVMALADVISRRKPYVLLQSTSVAILLFLSFMWSFNMQTSCESLNAEMQTSI